MAEIKHARGPRLLVKIARPEAPTVFTHYCTINAERGVTFTAGLNEQEVIDCDDLEKVAWLLREKTSLSMAVNANGTLNTPDVDTFYAFLSDKNSWPTKVILDVPGVDGGTVWTGKTHCSEFGITGTKGEKAQAAIAMASDGVITKTSNA